MKKLNKIVGVTLILLTSFLFLACGNEKKSSLKEIKTTIGFLVMMILLGLKVYHVLKTVV